MDIAEDDESECLTIRSVAMQIIDDVDDEGRFPDVSFNSLLKTLSETLNLHLSDKWRPQIKECVQGVINIKKALRQQDLYRDHEAIVRELRKDYYPSLNDDWDSCIKKWVVRIQEKVYFYIYSIYIYNSIYMTM